MSENCVNCGQPASVQRMITVRSVGLSGQTGKLREDALQPFCATCAATFDANQAKAGTVVLGAAGVIAAGGAMIVAVVGLVFLSIVAVAIWFFVV